MPLTLVLGPANSAKAGEVLGAYSPAARRGALLVVPTAADAVYYDRELAGQGLTLGRALTFPALLDEIADQAGYTQTRLTPLQRERVLRRSITESKLIALTEPARAPGFARAAGHLIAELRQARVEPRRFMTALRSWSESTAERRPYAADLATIYRSYANAVELTGRVDAETFAWGALDALRDRPARWPGTAVYLYGFDDFTPIELDAITTLARRVGVQVTVSLTYEPGRSALAARASVVQELRQQAQLVTELPALDSYYEPDSRAALHHLERSLFEPDPPSVDPGDAARLLEAGGERAEAELIAAEVLGSLADGFAAGEIVVVCRSLSRSGSLLEGTLRRYGIAATSARMLPLGHTALGRAVLAMARCALRAPDQATIADLLVCLRAPGVSAVPEEVDRLEADLRRSAVTKLVDLTSAAHRQAAHPALQAISQLRAAHDPLAVLSELTRALFVLPHMQRADTLSDEEQVDSRAAAVILTALIELGELGRGGMQGEELVEVLEGLQVPANPPVSAGEVLVAEPLAIRARRFRHVIVAGLCEGEFPSPQVTGGDPFLGDERRHELALTTDLRLPSEPDPLARERYLLYSCSSRATDRVTFSYRSSDEEGNIVMPSVFLADIADLFPPEWRQRRRRRLLADVTWRVEEAPTERERELARSAASGAAAQITTPATVQLSTDALAHVRHRERVSAGALELFAACPVRWLIERQLDASDLEPDPEPLARGSFMHAVLEQVIASLEGPLTPRSLPEAERVLRTTINATSHRIGHGQSAEVRAAVLRGIEADLRRYLQHEAADDGGWIPMRMELRFGTEGAPLPAVAIGEGEEQILLNGVIDRVDVEPGSGRRVIVRDYKSGAKKPTWPGARWLSDDQIQVALYMLAVQRLLGMEPVAGFYQPLSGDDLRPRGVYTRDAEVGDHAMYNDQLVQGTLEDLLGEIEQEALRIANVLRSGQLTPCPETCSPSGCRHPGICWAG